MLEAICMLIRTVGTGLGFVFPYFHCDLNSAGARILDSNYMLCWILELFWLHASDVGACYFLSLVYRYSIMNI